MTLLIFPQNGCTYVGCGESHADHSTVHSQVRERAPRAFTLDAKMACSVQGDLTPPVQCFYSFYLHNYRVNNLQVHLLSFMYRSINIQRCEKVFVPFLITFFCMFVTL